MTYDEGLCVQCMHIGPYDDEPATVEQMHCFMKEQGYALDISDVRRHHEIYLSDARRVVPGKLKTVIRHPIREVYYYDPVAVASFLIITSPYIFPDLRQEFSTDPWPAARCISGRP